MVSVPVSAPTLRGSEGHADSANRVGGNLRGVRARLLKLAAHRDRVRGKSERQIARIGDGDRKRGGNLAVRGWREGERRGIEDVGGRGLAGPGQFHGLGACPVGKGEQAGSSAGCSGLEFDIHLAIAARRKAGCAAGVAGDDERGGDGDAADGNCRRAAVGDRDRERRGGGSNFHAARNSRWMGSA